MTGDGAGERPDDVSSDTLARVLAAANAQIEACVERVRGDDWEAGTPCGIAVRDVVAHVIAGDVFAARLLGGTAAAEAAAGLEDLDAVLAVGDPPLPALVAAGAVQREAFLSADPRRSLDHPAGPIDLATFVRFRLGDLVVHAWDVAVGAGLGVDADSGLDEELVADLWGRIAPHRDAMRASGAYGDGASRLPADASVQARLLDAFGRRPA